MRQPARGLLAVADWRTYAPTALDASEILLPTRTQWTG